jgi:hypothetical protein
VNACTSAPDSSAPRTAESVAALVTGEPVGLLTMMK